MWRPFLKAALTVTVLVWGIPYILVLALTGIYDDVSAVVDRWCRRS